MTRTQALERLHKACSEYRDALDDAEFNFCGGPIGPRSSLHALEISGRLANRKRDWIVALNAVPRKKSHAKRKRR